MYFLERRINCYICLYQMDTYLPCYLCGSCAVYRLVHLSVSDLGIVVISYNRFYSVTLFKFTQEFIHSSFFFLLWCSSGTRGFKNGRQVLLHLAHSGCLSNLSRVGSQMKTFDCSSDEKFYHFILIFSAGAQHIYQSFLYSFKGFFLKLSSSVSFLNTLMKLRIYC